MSEYIYDELNKCYGKLGTRINRNVTNNNYIYYVGDLVLYQRKKGYIDYGILVEFKKGIYSVYGWGTTDLNNRDDITLVNRIIPYDIITNDIVKHMHSTLCIKEIEEKEMTLNDIEKLLGYKIKIIN